MEPRPGGVDGRALGGIQGFRGVWGIAFFGIGSYERGAWLVEKDKMVQGLDPYPSSLSLWGRTVVENPEVFQCGSAVLGCFLSL